MKEQILVSLGREHGSGGHLIAQMLAEQLGVNLYDRKLVEAAVQGSGYTEEMAERLDEKPINFFISRRIGEFSNSLEENWARKTFDFLRERAQSGESFVVVGRCAEQVLKGNPNLVRLFVCGELQAKLRRLMEVEHLSEERAAEVLREKDRRRKLYHNYYCEQKWGDSRGYDLTVNSSVLGLEGTAELLAQFVTEFRSR